MGIALSDEIKALFRGANFAHLSTRMSEGSPQVAPVWVDLDGDRILVCTGEGSLKAKNTRRDPRVGMSVTSFANPYFTVMDLVSRKYTGKPFPFRDNPAQRVVLVIEVEKARYTKLPFTHTPEVRR